MEGISDGQLSHSPKDSAVPTEIPSIETSYSWVRLLASITLSTLGCVGLWSLAVALPAVQADFGVPRAGASLPYALTMIGFMIGGITVGRFADRFGWNIVNMAIVIWLLQQTLGRAARAGASVAWTADRARATSAG